MCKNRQDLSRKSHVRKSVLLKKHIRKKYSQISYLTKKSNVDYQKNYQNSKIRNKCKTKSRNHQKLYAGENHAQQERQPIGPLHKQGKIAQMR